MSPAEGVGDGLIEFHIILSPSPPPPTSPPPSPPSLPPPSPPSPPPPCFMFTFKTIKILAGQIC